jgi:hypothetical protein
MKTDNVFKQGSFAGPRIGNAQYVNFVGAQNPNKGRNFRVTHFNDPVPNEPPQNTSFNGFYQHISPAYFIQTSANITPTANNFIIRPGIADENPLSPRGTTPVADYIAAFGQAHGFYINKVSSCATGTDASLPDLLQLVAPLDNLKELFPNAITAILQVLGLTIADIISIVPPSLQVIVSALLGFYAGFSPPETPIPELLA